MATSTKVLGIFGAGSQGREVFDLANRINDRQRQWDDIVFIDDVNPQGECYGSYRYQFASFLAATETKQVEAIVAVGEPGIRKLMWQKLNEHSISMATLIDPSAIISPSAVIKQGVIISEFTTVHANCLIQANALIQPHCTLNHDNCIGEHSVISAHSALGGNVTIGSLAFVGMQAVIRETLDVGNKSIVGMGAVVCEHVADDVTVLGNPARLHQRDKTAGIFKR